MLWNSWKYSWHLWKQRRRSSVSCFQMKGSCDEADRDRQCRWKKKSLFVLPSLCLPWQLWSPSLSLCHCLSASFSLYHYILFVFISEIPWWWFSLLILFKLPACCKFSLTLSCPFIFVFVLFIFVILLPSHYLPLNSAIVNSNLSWII